jgi:hypothetical protein
MITVSHEADVVNTSNAKMLVNSAIAILKPLATHVIVCKYFGSAGTKILF